MRKQLKNKKASCSMCKPHKRGLANRWKAKDLAVMKIDIYQDNYFTAGGDDN